MQSRKPELGCLYSGGIFAKAFEVLKGKIIFYLFSNKPLIFLWVASLKILKTELIARFEGALGKESNIFEKRTRGAFQEGEWSHCKPMRLQSQ